MRPPAFGGEIFARFGLEGGVATVWIVTAVAMCCCLLRGVDGAAFTTVEQGSKCEVRCRNFPDRAVCASNGVTYPSRCLMQCYNLSLTVRNRGRCGSPVRATKSCHEDLEYARKRAHATNYTPACKPDGSYAPVQCNQLTGTCWCVDPRGRNLPEMQVVRNQRGRPRCIQTIGFKNNPRRRSSPRSRRPKRNCKRMDKMQFNNNLIDKFIQDWKHVYHNKASGGYAADIDSAAILWKFRQMDLNDDLILDKAEYRDLKELIKKAVKPKRCAKNFFQSCDINKDQRIVQQEWKDCLRRDGMDGARPGVGVDADDDDEGDDLHEPEYEDEDISQGGRSSPPHGVLQTPQHTNQQHYSEPEEISGCLQERANVLADQNQRDIQFVPECTPDGLYKRVQCFRSVGYCWCVHEDTGKNIPGTSLKSEEPDCDRIKTKPTKYNRPMKGCKEPRKSQFLKSLMSFFIKTMIANGANVTGMEGGIWKAPKEEQAATWNFVVLDKNKNSVLDRKEWKAFRALVSEQNALKKCGKKLPRYCDVNQDRKIEMSEWLDCLDIETTPSLKPKATNSSVTHPVRQGPNPLEMLLQD